MPKVSTVRKRRSAPRPAPVAVDAPEAYVNRELSWLAFARRVLAQAQDPGIPLLERLKFAGIMGVLHDEFFMKRVGGLRRLVQKGVEVRSIDGRLPREELEACRSEIQAQSNELSKVFRDELRPALAEAGVAIKDYKDVGREQREYLAGYFETSVQPILTPLAVDAEHPFPFISNLGLNLAIWIIEAKRRPPRFVRIKVPGNRPRWVPLSDGSGFVPLEQVIAAHLGQFFPEARKIEAFMFKVIRGVAMDEADERTPEEWEQLEPGAIVDVVTNVLKTRRFAEVTRLLVETRMPEDKRTWLVEQLECMPEDVYTTDNLLSLSDLLELKLEGYPELRFPPHEPVTHPRLRNMDAARPGQIFDIIRQEDILLHHPYQSFDSSVVRFLQAAAADPQVLALKLTIYRTSSDSPIIKALVDAARRGKQVAVLIEITARFDEEPNIAWGQLLEREGAHVTYGVERLKTHVKLALVVREEHDGIRRYVHVGTGNYHTGTARQYVDLGLLSADPVLAADVADVFITASSCWRPMRCARASSS
jgi:polyphosphate kinase